MAARLSGVVRHWSVDGGFGFINDGQSDYFCHSSQLKNCYFLQASDKVNFIGAPSKKKTGKMDAREVYLADGKDVTMRIMGRGGLGSSITVKSRGRAEPSSSSTVPVIDSQKEVPEAAAPHRQAVGPAKGVHVQPRRTSKADQQTGPSTGASSLHARATATAAAPAQHGSATLPKVLGEESQSAKLGSWPVLNHKEMQCKGDARGKKDRAMQKRQMNLLIETTDLDVVAKAEAASCKIPSSEDLETMSATTMSSLEASESVRDSDTDSCQCEPIEEVSFDNPVTQQAKAVTLCHKQPAAITQKYEVPATGGAQPAAAPAEAGTSMSTTSNQCDKDDVVLGQEIGSYPSWGAYGFSSQAVIPAGQNDPSVQQWQDAPGSCCWGSLSMSGGEGGRELGVVHGRQQSISGGRSMTYSSGSMPPANAPQIQQTGGRHSTCPEVAMAMTAPAVPAATGLSAGFTLPSVWTLPALPTFYVDRQGGVHPLQQMMAPVAVPISNFAGVNGYRPNTS